MFEKTVQFGQWAGPATDISRAVQVATEEIARATGVRSSVNVTIEYATGLTERSDDLADFERLHASELRNIRSLWIQIGPDEDELWKERSDARDRGEEPPPTPRAKASIRLWTVARYVEVEGANRSAVEGLSARLGEILGRGSRGPTWYSAPIAAAGVVLLFWPAVLLGTFMARWLDLASKNDRWDTAELVGGACGAAVVVGVALAVWRLAPDLEIVPEGQQPRLRRFRAWLIGVAVALVVSIVAAFIYDQLKSDEKGQAPSASALAAVEPHRTPARA